MDRIDEALAEAGNGFRSQRPKTWALHERASAVMPGGNTRTILHHGPYPIRIASAQGQRLVDVDGHRYTDFLGEYSAGIYGHSHPVIAEAVREALATGVNMGAQHCQEIDFAEVVTKRFNLDLVRFCNSGTEANMLALGLAKACTGRAKYLGIAGGYHGGTLFLSHAGTPVNAPYDFVLATYNDVAGTRALIAEHGQALAAVILEPMLGGAGCIPAARAYLQMLREETERHGILLIFDEVMTSRLAPGGLSAAHGIEPDLKTLGKYVGGGMSFGGFGGKRALMQRFDPTRPEALPHAGTFNNNTLTMTAGYRAMTEVYTPDACIALNARGDRLRQALNDLFMRYQAPMQAIGVGSMLSIQPLSGEIVNAEQAAKADPRLRKLLYLDLLDQGYYIAERGFMALSLIVEDADCDGLVGAVESHITRRRDVLMH